MTVDVVVLVSCGRHPVSGRPRRAALDARAVELALRLGDVRIELVHAGHAGEPALADYFGMGPDDMTVLDVEPGDDIVPPLTAHLRHRPGALVLTGARAETGEAGGMVPYLLAEALGRPIVPGAAGLSLNAGRVDIAQGLAGGGRRAVQAPHVSIVTVSAAAPDPRPVAFAKARRGQITNAAYPTSPYALPGVWQPARAKPRRLKVVGAGSAAERVKAATQMVQGRAQVLDHPDPDSAAEAIWSYLVAEGLVRDGEASAENVVDKPVPD
jgi:N,N-dimethylglycine/sarcosine catabolism electron transfer flavoprotein subunit beta